MRELGKEESFFLRARVNSNAAMEAAWPTQMVTTAGRTNLHRVINGHSCRDRTNLENDIERNVFLRVFRFQEQQLGVTRSGRGRRSASR